MSGISEVSGGLLAFEGFCSMQLVWEATGVLYFCENSSKCKFWFM
jgi:hypothetical protein